MSNHELAFAGVVLLAVLVVLVGIQLLRSRTPQEQAVREDVSDAIDTAVERLDAAVRHHVEVNAVLALTNQFTDDPELLRRLADYSRQVVGAALMYRVNSLGEQLKTAQDQLQQLRRRQVESNGTYYANLAAAAQKLVTELLRQLEEANGAVQAFNRPRAVS